MRTPSKARSLATAAFVAGLAALFALPSAAAPGLPLPTPPSPTTAPAPSPSLQAPASLPGPISNPLGIQPGTPSSCSFQALGPAEMRVVDDEPSGRPWWWGQALSVDPWNPCHLYMTDGAGYPYRIMRGEIGPGGTTTWSPVFEMPAEPEDPATATTPSPGGYPPAPVVNQPNAVWFAGATATTASVASQTRVFRSGDAGWHWSESDNGLLLHSQQSGFTRLIAAPTDPRTLYLVSVGNPGGANTATGASLISVSHDGGQTWQTSAVPKLPAYNEPKDAAAAFAIDPADAASLYYLEVGTSTAAPVLWSTHDSGRTWLPQAATAGFGNPVVLGNTSRLGPSAADELFATHAAGGGLTLYAHVETEQTSFYAAWYRSRDAGASWEPLPLPFDVQGCPPDISSPYAQCGHLFAQHGSFLAADPTNPNVLVWVAGEGLSGAQPSLRFIETTDGFGGAPLITRWATQQPGSFPEAVSLQTDASGDFFLAADVATQSGVADGIIAFRPSALTAARGAASLIASPPPSSPPPSQFLPPTNDNVVPTPRQALCPIPSSVSGSLTFDGRYLDYAQGNAAPGVISRVFAVNCSPAPSLVMAPSDFASGQVPAVSALTYDGEYKWPSGEQGAIIAAGLPGSDPAIPNQDAPIYAINPVTAAARFFTSVDMRSNQCSDNGQGAAPTFFAPERSAADATACPVVSGFAYDIFRNGLWTQSQRPDDPSTQVPPLGFLDLATGHFTPNRCGYGWDNAGLAVAGPSGVVYWQDEDDKTLYKQNMDDCSVSPIYYRHSYIGENQSEDEQMTCDAVTFATPVIWERDGVGTNIQAYSVPDPYCPFPTSLSYRGPSTAKPGAPAQLCFTLKGALAGQWQPLYAQTITVKLGGITAGQPVTDAAGQACVGASAPVAAGAMLVQGSFAGTQGYLPSGAEGTLVVPPTGSGQVPEGIPLPPGRFGTPPPPQPVNAQPNPAPGTEPVGSSAAQAEAQTQAQTQQQHRRSRSPRSSRE